MWHSGDSFTECHLIFTDKWGLTSVKAYDPSPVFKRIWKEYSEETGEKVPPDIREAIEEAFLDYSGEVGDEDEALCLRDVIPTFISLIQYGEERARRRKRPTMLSSDEQPGSASDQPPQKRTYPKNQKRQIAILEFVALQTISKESIAKGDFPGTADWETLAGQWNVESPQRPLSAAGLRRAYFRAKRNEDVHWALREKYENYYPWPDFGLIHAMRQSAALYQAQRNTSNPMAISAPFLDIQRQLSPWGMGITVDIHHSFAQHGLMSLNQSIEHKFATLTPFTTTWSHSLIETSRRLAESLGIAITDELDDELEYDPDETDEERAARVRKARNRAIMRKAKAKLGEFYRMKQRDDANS